MKSLFVSIFLLPLFFVAAPAVADDIERVIPTTQVSTMERDNPWFDFGSVAPVFVGVASDAWQTIQYDYAAAEAQIIAEADDPMLKIQFFQPRDSSYEPLLGERYDPFRVSARIKISVVPGLKIMSGVPRGGGFVGGFRYRF